MAPWHLNLCHTSGLQIVAHHGDLLSQASGVETLEGKYIYTFDSCTIISFASVTVTNIYEYKYMSFCAIFP